MMSFAKRILLCFFSTCLFSFTLADTGTITITKNIDIPVVAHFNDIGLRFCDNGYDALQKTDQIIVRPGQKKEVCLVFFSTATTGDISVTVGLTPATLSNDGKLLCDADMNTGHFASLFRYDYNDLNFILKPGQRIVKKLILDIPKDLSGSFYGCVGYQPEQEKPSDFKEMFFVVRRKVGPMSIDITGNVYNFGRWDTIKFAYKDHQISILKTVAIVLVLLLIYYIVASTKGKNNPPHKKK